MWRRSSAVNDHGTMQLRWQLLLHTIYLRTGGDAMPYAGVFKVDLCNDNLFEWDVKLCEFDSDSKVTIRQFRRRLQHTTLGRFICLAVFHFGKEMWRSLLCLHI